MSSIGPGVIDFQSSISVDSPGFSAVVRGATTTAFHEHVRYVARSRRNGA
jgi:hypothetical protein